MKPFHKLSDDEWAERVRQAVALPDAPPALIQRVLDAWPRGGPQPVSPAIDLAGLARGAQLAGRRLLASLSFDSWTGSALASGLRGGRSETRQLLFSADGRDIDLRIQAGPAGYAVSGQVLGPDEAGSVRLEPATAGPDAPPAAEAPFDDMGEFHLAPVAAGRYLLVLQLAGLEIGLPPIELGPAAGRAP